MCINLTGVSPMSDFGNEVFIVNLMATNLLRQRLISMIRRVRIINTILYHLHLTHSDF